MRWNNRKDVYRKQLLKVTKKKRHHQPEN